MRNVLAIATVLGAACSSKSTAGSGAQPVPALEHRPIEIERLGRRVAVSARVPVGWEQSGGSFSEPAELPSPYDPDLNYAVGDRSCDGECDDGDLRRSMDRMIDGLVPHWTAPFLTRDPEIDSQRMNVAVLDQGRWPDGRFMVLKVTRQKPEGRFLFDILLAVCARHRSGDDYYVTTTAKAPLDAEATLWPVLVEACKTPWYQSAEGGGSTVPR